ncbi:hypothetical protein [Luteolibacter soli]|uniref:Secreted protein n=1 Tax=Luteolibacter soli TaxID=3135280 RepID=A0ABU9AQ89_9BACT
MISLPVRLGLVLGVLAFCQAKGEDLNLLAENTSGQEGSSQSITLGQGESAKLLYGSPGFNARLRCEIGTKTFDLSCFKGGTWDINPIVIAGPATITLKSGGVGNGASSGFVTLGITRIGLTSGPTSIPQEEGSTFEVILESSSDLVNWLVINPGEYSGTEARRFFRMRIVKKDPP